MQSKMEVQWLCIHKLVKFIIFTHASDPLVLLTQTFIITVILLLFLSDFLKYNTHI